jgi:two-component system response regulator AtoC
LHELASGISAFGTAFANVIYDGPREVRGSEMVAEHGIVEHQVKILVTDDDQRWREGLREAFEPRGYETLEAESGEEAIEVVHDVRPHLVILDIQLPHLNGIETLRIIRQELGGDLPAIVVSSNVTDRELAEALALHAYTVMSKMAGLHQILFTVARVLQKYYRI